MKIRKISAISSTNAYLKQLVLESRLESFTVVSADYQNKGKGQATKQWFSEKGKNLLFSILIKFNSLDISKQAFLNFAISIGIYQALKQHYPIIKIKWPNDIMADDKKISGILIENSVKGSLINHSIVGIGLNVNQLKFSTEIPNAVSLRNLLNKEFYRDVLLVELLDSIQKQISLLAEKDLGTLKANYEKNLYKKGIPSMFKTTNNKPFLGKIIGVSSIGLLQIELENGAIKEFANKEVFFNNAFEAED